MSNEFLILAFALLMSFHVATRYNFLPFPRRPTFKLMLPKNERLINFATGKILHTMLMPTILHNNADKRGLALNNVNR